MPAEKIAAELASGGAYTAWFVVVVLAGVVVHLYRELEKRNRELLDAYKEEDAEILQAIHAVTKTQNEHTTILATVLGILKGQAG